MARAFADWLASYGTVRRRGYDSTARKSMFGHGSLLPLAVRRAVALLPLLSETEWVADLPVPPEIMTMRFRQKSVWLLFAAG
jgi:hypothetical protein